MLFIKEVIYFLEISTVKELSCSEINWKVRISSAFTSLSIQNCLRPPPNLGLSFTSPVKFTTHESSAIFNVHFVFLFKSFARSLGMFCKTVGGKKWELVISIMRFNTLQ